jgi:large subunit ribosomal protein L21
MRRCSLVYAIIKTGGKQYMVNEGDVLNVEKLEVESGEKVMFEEVLAVGDNGELQIGNPVVSGAKVEATVVGSGKAKKVIVFKYKPKKDYRKKQGHRQPFTKVKIEKINA